ncbi:MAG: hypothetical protein ACLFOY_06750 [Desulfatibacillaceae bacterium]
MARKSDVILDTGDNLPTHAVTLLDGNMGSLPDLVGPEYGIIILYRGKW